MKNLIVLAAGFLFSNGVLAQENIETKPTFFEPKVSYLDSLKKNVQQPRNQCLYRSKMD